MTTSNEILFVELEGYPGYRVGTDGSVWSKWIRRGNGHGKGVARVIGPEWKQLKQSAASNG